MSTERVDFLFRGSHPSFFWAAALLKKKGKSVAILPQPEVHSWELLPTEALSFLGVEGLKTNRDQNPIQILTKKCRFGVFSDLEFTKKDFNFCSGNAPAPELNRGLSFYAKGSDYQAIFGENSSELLKEAHRMEYFDLKPEKIISQATAHLRTMGIVFFDDDQNLPIAEQTIILDVTRAKVFRTRFEFTLPMGKLPTGASNRMLLVERGSPLIEMIHFDSILHVRTLLPEGPSLVQNMVNAITPYFSDIKINPLETKITPHHVFNQEWTELKSHVDASKLGTWLISPAVNPELGERSLYIRISELLRQKYKKEQIFEVSELF